MGGNAHERKYSFVSRMQERIKHFLDRFKLLFFTAFQKGVPVLEHISPFLTVLRKVCPLRVNACPDCSDCIVWQTRDHKSLLHCFERRFGLDVIAIRLLPNKDFLEVVPHPDRFLYLRVVFLRYSEHFGFRYSVHVFQSPFAALGHMVQQHVGI